MSTPAIMNVFDPLIAGLCDHVDFPNSVFEPSDLNDAGQPIPEYLRVRYIESQPEQSSYGQNRIPSILQIDHAVRAASGNRSALIQTVIDTFSFKTELSSGAVSIRIDRAPTIATSFNVNGWYITPITIYYEVYR